MLPDNRWYLYSINLPPSDVSEGTNTLQLNQIPWYGTGVVKKNYLTGSYSALYYNPRKPNAQTATTYPTDSNTYKFGCTVISWHWGDLMTMRKSKYSQHFQSIWRETPSMTYALQQTNPIQIWQQDNGKFKWENAFPDFTIQPALGSDTLRLCSERYDPAASAFSPKTNGFKFFAARSISNTFNIVPTVPNSTAKPLFFFSYCGLACNMAGGNTPCPTQYCMFFGGLGSFSVKDNIPDNLFQGRTTDLSKNYASFQGSGTAQFNAQAGDNRFTLAWQMAVDGSGRKPQGFKTFLPKAHFLVLGQMVYQGNLNIFNK